MQPAASAVRRLGRALLTLLLAIGASACFKGQPAIGTSDERVVLMVSNRGYFDINIYAVRSTVVSGRRIGTVTGNTTTTLFIPATELQPGGQLALLVRAIGSRSSWMSPLVAVGPGVVARLDVYATNAGDLSQSQLFTQPAVRPDTSDSTSDRSHLTDDAMRPTRR
ncbi:MAG: hypothetical protein RLZZ621_43 [Gemmatimonadota bacterium]|jgi:hypothetical protein